MDMKRERRKVYLRCFALLLGLWLALAGVFSAYVLQNAWSQERDRFIQTADNLADQLRGTTDTLLQMRYAAFLLDAPENEDVSYEDYLARVMQDRELYIDTDFWNSNVRRSEASELVTAALFTYEGEPH